MILKAFNLTPGALVAFSVWCAALLVAVLALHVFIAGGRTAYQLIHS